MLCDISSDRKKYASWCNIKWLIIETRVATNLYIKTEPLKQLDKKQRERKANIKEKYKFPTVYDVHRGEEKLKNEIQISKKNAWQHLMKIAAFPSLTHTVFIDRLQEV